MAFRREQPTFTVEPARIAAERPVAADHAVAWNQHRDMIVAIGGADRANSLGLTDRGGDVGIAARLARRDFAQLAPDGFLEGRPGDIDRQIADGKRLLDRGKSALD